MKIVLQWDFAKRTNAFKCYGKTPNLGGTWCLCTWAMGGENFTYLFWFCFIGRIYICHLFLRNLCFWWKSIWCGMFLWQLTQLFIFIVLAASYFFSFVKQCFLLQLISSGQAERSSSFSSSMMRIFQRGLLRQRCYFLPCT